MRFSIPRLSTIPILIGVTAVFALSAPSLIGQGGEERPTILEQLNSGKPAAIEAALGELERGILPPDTWAAPIVATATRSAPALRRRLTRLLSHCGEPGRELLLEIAGGPDEPAAIVAMRALGQTKDAKVAAQLMRLLDDDRPRVSTEAAVAIYGTADDAIVAKLVQRLRTLIKLADQPEFNEGRRKETIRRGLDMLRLLGRRKNADAFAIAIDLIERSPHLRFRTVSARILQSDFPERSKEEIRRIFLEAPLASRDLARVVIDANPMPGDRDLGWKIETELPPRVHDKLLSLQKATRNWCGKIGSADSAGAMKASYSLWKAGASSPRTVEVRIPPRNDRSMALRAIDLQLPIAELLTWPDLWNANVTTTAQGRQFIEARLKPNRHHGQLMIGLGSRQVGTWLGRQRLQPSRLLIDLDSLSRPVTVKSFDANGSLLGTSTFGDWKELEDRTFVPRSITWSSPSLILRAKFRVLPNEDWALDEALSSFPNGKPGGAPRPAGRMKAQFQFEEASPTKPAKTQSEGLKR